MAANLRGATPGDCFSGGKVLKTLGAEKAVDDSIGVFGISGFFSRVRNNTKCRRFSA
jgi:hypothetical protein